MRLLGEELRALFKDNREFSAILDKENGIEKKFALCSFLFTQRTEGKCPIIQSALDSNIHSYFNRIAVAQHL